MLPGSGLIVAAQLVRKYIAVWTDNGLYQARSIRPSRIGPGQWLGLYPRSGKAAALIGPNAMVVLASQTAYWFGSNGQFHACTLGGVPQIVPCPMQEDVFANIAASQQGKIVASACAEVRRDQVRLSRHPRHAAAQLSAGRLGAGRSPMRREIPSPMASTRRMSRTAVTSSIRPAATNPLPPATARSIPSGRKDR